MLVKLLAWLMIIMGIVFLVKPEFLRKKLQKKSMKYVKKVLFAITIFFAIFLISAGWKAQGIRAKILVVLGIIGIFKAAFLLKARAAEKLIEWFINQRIIFFRLWASGQIVLGIAILLLNK